MRVLEGEKPGNAVNIENGAVVLNLVPAVNAVLGRLQDRGVLTDKNLPDLDESQSPQQQISALSDALGLDLKPTFGQITVYQNANIDHAETYVSLAQKIAKQIKRLVVLIVLVALVLIAVTILVAYDRRRAVIMLGIGIAVAVVLAQIAEKRLVERIPLLLTDADSRAAAESVVSVFTHSLGNVNVALFVIGILAALIGFMARPGGVDLKGHPEVARIAIGALALGALWIAGPALVVGDPGGRVRRRRLRGGRPRRAARQGRAALADAEATPSRSPPEPPVSSTSAPTSS